MLGGDIKGYNIWTPTEMGGYQQDTTTPDLNGTMIWTLHNVQGSARMSVIPKKPRLKGKLLTSQTLHAPISHDGSITHFSVEGMRDMLLSSQYCNTGQAELCLHSFERMRENSSEGASGHL